MGWVLFLAGIFMVALAGTVDGIAGLILAVAGVGVAWSGYQLKRIRGGDR